MITSPDTLEMRHKCLECHKCHRQDIIEASNGSFFF